MFSSRRFKILFYEVIFVVFCVFVWWLTTGAYQVSLPNSSIESLNVSRGVEPNFLIIKMILKKISSFRNFGYRINIELFTPSSGHKSKVGSDNEDIYEIFKQHVDVGSSEYEIDRFLSTTLPQSESIDDYVVFVHCGSDGEGENIRRDIFFGSGRYFWTHNTLCTGEYEPGLIRRISEILHPYRDESCENCVNENTFENSLSSRVKIDHQWRETTRISFTLVNCDHQKSVLSWDFPSIEKRYLKTLIKRLRRIYPNLFVDSQVIHHGSLPEKTPKKREIGEELFRSVKLSAMKYLLNHNPDWTLESLEDSDREKSVHMILLYPPSKFIPVKIETTAHEYHESYIIPQFGGVTFTNFLPPEFNQKSKKFQNSILLGAEELEREMSQITKQLKILFGLPVCPSHLGEGLHLTCFSQNGVSDWELDFLIRKLTLDHLSDASESLKALSQISESLASVNIQNVVKHHVEESLKAIEQSWKSLQSGNVNDAFLSSRIAISESEKAFFHPTIDNEMYFTAYQSFAVYLPLVLCGYNILKLAKEFFFWKRRANKSDRKLKIKKE